MSTEVLSYKEAAFEADVSERTIHRWVRRYPDSLKVRKVNKRVHYLLRSYWERFLKG